MSSTSSSLVSGSSGKKSPSQLRSVWVRIIAGIQTVGGLLGMLIAIFMLVSQKVPTSSVKTILIPSILAMVAGVKLWRSTAGGLELSVIVQFVQCVSLMRPHVFVVHFGVALDMIVTTTGIRFSPELGTTVFTGPIGDSPDLFGLNLIALVSLVYLLALCFRTGGTLKHDPLRSPSKIWWLKKDTDLD